MIKGNELRQGNKIYGEHRYSAESKPHMRVCTILSVAQYGSDCSYAFADTEHIPNCPDGVDGLAFWRYEFMHPIPLTPEILEKCGFEPHYNVNSDQDEVEWLAHSKLDYVTYKDGKFDMGYGFGSLDHIQYLHQLQNLFFSMTGEELEVKL